MAEKEQILQMLQMQQKLNDDTNGIGWESGYTKQNKLISWKRCIYMECAELIESFAWKHWKDIAAPIDWENAKIEIVDIWHFILSLALEHYKSNSLGDMEKLASDIASLHSFKTFCKDDLRPNESDSFDILNNIEKMMHISTGHKFNLLDKLLNIYFEVAHKCGVNLRELYIFYMAKNILNQFRQDHGYKEGKYIKNWNGKEDNVVMTDLLKDNHANISELYQKLETIYTQCQSFKKA